MLICLVFALLIAALAVCVGITGIVYAEDFPSEVIYGESYGETSRAFFRKTNYEYRKPGEEDWHTEQPISVGEYEARSVTENIAGSSLYGEIRRFSILPATVKVDFGSTVCYGENPSYSADMKFGDELHIENFIYEKLSNNLFKIQADTESLTVLNSSGEDVAGNYNFVFTRNVITIAPRPVTFETESATFTYDGKTHYASGVEAVGGLGLAEGHTAYTTNATIVTEAGVYENKANVCILDSDGENVTGYYDVDVKYGNLNVNPKPIKVRTESGEAEFDGAYHFFNKLEIDEGSLIKGHHAYVTTWSSDAFLDAGEYINKTDIERIHISENGDRNVTSNYSIELEYGLVKILPKQITVQTGSFSWIYDGEEHSYGELELAAGELADNHMLGGTDFASVKNAGEYDNTVKARIIDREANADVTKNYSISINYGKLSISKRTLELKTASDSWVYDGKEHCNYNVEPIGNFSYIPGHKPDVEVLSGVTIKDVGRRENNFGFNLRIYDGDGNDMSDNYSVDNTVYGTLNISHRTATITTQSKTFEYDGLQHSYLSYEYSKKDLAEGHTLNGQTSDWPTLTDVGSVENKMSFKIEVTDSENNDVTSNYKFEYKYGTLTISPRPIQVKTPSLTYVYDGTLHYMDKKDIEVETSNLLGGHKLIDFSIQNKYELRDVGVGSNIVTLNLEIRDENNKDVSSSYIPVYEYGALMVKPRPVTIRSRSQTWVYDGNKHFLNEFDIISSGEPDYGIVSGHHITARSDGIKEITDTPERVGYQDNKLTFTITDVTGTDVTQNYDIDAEWGQLRIKSSIQIHFLSISKYYDGKPLLINEDDYSITNLPPDVNKEWVFVKVNSNFTEVGLITTENLKKQCETRITDGDGNDLSGENRFDFSIEDGQMSILPRRIEISSISISKVRGEQPLRGYGEEDCAWISLGTLAEGHKIEITVTGILNPNQDEVENTIYSVKIFDENHNSVTRNYDIVLKPGTLKWL